MSAPERHFDATEEYRVALRSAVAEVEHFITHLPNRHAGPDRDLPGAWAALIKILNLGTAQKLRDCPRCGHVAMRDATLCSHCWAHLPPLPRLQDSLPDTRTEADQ